MTDELDQTQTDLRAYIGDNNPDNFTNTQGFLRTSIVWTMTEAAELLATRCDPDIIAQWTAEDRSKALADIIGNIIRQSLTVSPIRDELMAGAPTTYSGRTALETGEVPSVFDDPTDTDGPDN